MRNLNLLERFRKRNWERELFGTTGNERCGCFCVYVGGRSFTVVASSDGGWEHVSVSPRNQKRKSCPTWEEMCAIKDMFFEQEERVVQYHPPKSEYVNNHPYCLHLWRPTNSELPYPPKIFV